MPRIVLDGGTMVKNPVPIIHPGHIIIELDETNQCVKGQETGEKEIVENEPKKTKQNLN